MASGQVTELHLGGNGLRGEIPPELGNLEHLRELWFGDGNRITGEFPPELSKLTRLEVLDLGFSEMSGPIPAWLGGLKRLRSLYLDNNRFEGELPAELGNLSRLELLTLFGNRGLIGALPDTLTGIEDLQWVPFHETGLCAPVDESFQAWLRNIPNHEGPDCPPEPTVTPTPAPAAAVQEEFTTILHPGWNMVGWVEAESPANNLFKAIPRLENVGAGRDPWNAGGGLSWLLPRLQGPLRLQAGEGQRWCEGASHSRG